MKLTHGLFWMENKVETYSWKKNRKRESCKKRWTKSKLSLWQCGDHNNPKSTLLRMNSWVFTFWMRFDIFNFNCENYFIEKKSNLVMLSRPSKYLFFTLSNAVSPNHTKTSRYTVCINDLVNLILTFHFRLEPIFVTS